MPDKLENTNGEEMTLATADGDWANQIAMLLLFALFANWGFTLPEHEDPDK